MVTGFLSRLIILVFGTLYPAYASYKAVRTKNVKEYVKWMMYWIVFALFTCAETFADIFLSWVPFYYEIKIIFLLWLLSPATRGSSILYRQFVHPELMKREQHIDQYIDRVKSQGYTALVHYGSQGLNLAVKTALTAVTSEAACLPKGQTKLVDQLKKSYSMSDLSQPDNDRQVFVAPEPIAEAEDEPDRPADRERRFRDDSPLGGTRDNRQAEMVDPARYAFKQGEYEGVRPAQDEYVRAQEYHGVSAGGLGGRATRASSRRTTYNHEESLHYGTLPKRRSTRQPPRPQMPSGWR